MVYGDDATDGWTKGYRGLWHWAPVRKVGEVRIPHIPNGSVVVAALEAIDNAACGALVRGHEAFVARANSSERTCRRCRRAYLDLPAYQGLPDTKGPT